ncbi:MAG: GNAT family N-acetyltransferase [Thermomicrobiales bacterium]
MHAERSELPVEIRSADEAALPILARHFLPSDRALDHARRFALQQQGDGTYLIAWRGAEPVGHCMLRWHGPAADPTGHYPRDTPYLEAALTKPADHGKGVGTRLILEAERIARARECKQIGLTVSSAENPRARRLYERLGYRA